VYPVKRLQEDGNSVSGYFFNPNIHPYREFKRRIAALRLFSELSGFQVTIDSNYGLTEFIREVVHNEHKRCGICYDLRLQETARYAAETGSDAFTSTLLYSKYQNHELICTIAEQYARQYNIQFYYEDFRTGWQYGIDKSIEMDLYRQPYCGCIYSEQERYDKKLRRNKGRR